MRRLSPSRRLVLLIALLATVVATGVLFAQDETDPRPAGPLNGTMTYTIIYGDVLDVLAARYDVDLRCLIETNNLTSTLDLLPGDQIIISADCPLYTGVGVIVYPRGSHDTIVQAPGGAGNIGDNDQGGGAAPAGPGEAVYIVQLADVMDLIAAAFNEDLDCIVERNGFPRRFGPIFPGDEVIIPSSCPPYTGLSEPLPRGPGPQPADLTASWSRTSGGGATLPPSATPTTGAGVLPTQETILLTSTPVPPVVQPTQESLATAVPTQAILATSTFVPTRLPTVTPTLAQPLVPPQQTQEVGATG